MSKEITKENIDSIINDSGKVVMINFWADWCGPCRMLNKTIEELAFEYREDVIIGKMDIDKNEYHTDHYKVRNVPTMLFFKDGKVVNKKVGALPKSILSEVLDELIEG